MQSPRPAHYEAIAQRVLAGDDRFLVPAGASESDELTPGDLARQTARLLDDDLALGYLAQRSGDELALRHGLSRLPLPAALGSLLTFVRSERPALLEHILVVTLITHYLALRQGLSERKTNNLLLAALCHDLGELLIHPKLLDPRHRITDDERRYLYAHPITGHLMAREISALDASVATAVLQHQERLDGSGYPYGLSGDQICTDARVIGIADVGASILARFGSHERLGALMRLNRKKFDPQLLALLQEGLPTNPADHAEVEPLTLAPPRLMAAARLLGQWSVFRAHLQNGDGTASSEADFLLERMANLRSMLLSFGFDPESQQLLLTLAAEDPQLAAELAAALDEVHWQFADLEREIVRRRQLVEGKPHGQKSSLDGWLAELRTYLGTYSTAAD